MKPRILLSYVHMGGTERDWVEKAFESEWIVPLGPNVDEFEHRLEKYLARQTLWLSAQAQLPSILHWLPSALALEMR